MSDDVVRVSGPINAAGLEMTLESRQARTASPTVPSWSRSAAPRCSRPSATSKPREGIDFFPLTVDVEERDVRRGQDPRLVLPP